MHSQAEPENTGGLAHGGTYLAIFLDFCAFSILAHVSRSDTVLLKTSFPGEESTGSTQKWPNLSNWTRLIVWYLLYMPTEKNM